MSQEITVKFQDFPNVGILHCRVPDDILHKLYNRLAEIEKNNFAGLDDNRANLLGHIDKEYSLLDCIPVLEPFLLDLVNMYDSNYQYSESVVNVAVPTNLQLTNLWVNYQKKHEFNPPHTHGGVFSFAIWMKIPYNLNEEEAVFPVNSGGPPRNSKFTFHYVNVLGKMGHMVIPVDKSFEGVICLFPSELAHSVNPFYTSDEYRVSIAGNLKLIPRQ